MGHPTYVSSDGGVGVKALGPRDSEERGEREGRTGTEDNGNAVSTRSHMVETRKGEEGDGGGWR